MFNPAKASKNIKEEFESYIETTFHFNDENLREQFHQQLNEIISKGPYLEINSIFAQGLSIEELINKNILSPLFRDLEANKTAIKPILPLTRKLYKHQEEAIRNIVNGNNVVITTGTGSGKTNCFLIPVIDELLKEKEKGTLGPGIRAIFIYPMNALANDQLKNLRKLLLDYEDITFGVYTGSTEYDERSAINLYEAMFANEKIEKLRHRLPNELLSRDEMKNNPPNILFTNYAMLEHLLFRPNDDVLFTKSNFKFVVLDEAHVYSGATGIETSLLIRRLKARISSNNKIQFILTSATLGKDSSVDDQIIDFASNLTGEHFQKENIIRSQRINYIKEITTFSYNFKIISELADEQNSIIDVLDKYNIKHNNTDDESELIYDFVKTSDLYHKLRQFYLLKENENIASLGELKQLFNTKRIEDVISFIFLCTRAHKNGRKLIDARYHFFIRSLEGAFITLEKNKKLFLNRRQNDDDYAVFEIAICNECGKLALLGKIENNKLIQKSKLKDKIDYFYLASEANNEIESEDESIDNESYYLCPHCGSIVPANARRKQICNCNPDDLIKIIRIKKPNEDDSGSPHCRNCHVGHYKRFYLGNDAATSVLATSLYEELPELTYVTKKQTSKSKVDFENPFAKALISSSKKDQLRKAKQFLIFSDSRQEAAKFACYLSNIYQEFLRRRGIVQIIEKYKNYLKDDGMNIEGFVKLLSDYFANNKTFISSYSDQTNLNMQSLRNAWVAVLNELARYKSPTSLSSLGLIQFEYLGNTKNIIENVSNVYRVSEESAKNLLNILIFEIINSGALITGTDFDIGPSERNYIFYSEYQKFITDLKSNNNKSQLVTNWLPTQKNNASKTFYKTNKLYYTMKYLNCNEEKAYEFLKNYYQYLTEPQFGNEYLLVDPNKEKKFVLPATSIKIIPYYCDKAKWYKCKKCGRITQFNINNHCVSVKCDGEVELIDPIDIRKNNHYANLYFGENMSPLFVKEHTAQLSKKESAEYQEEFIKKEINALSCSTTFEMGVDVGDLETVFLRDVPPLPSNYSQRAGRAGRSIDSAAFCLTFAKLSSHDLSFYKNPELMINGTILPPIFKLDNEKIVKRHIYDVAFSLYFAINPDQYNSNDASKFINEKGYLDFINFANEKSDNLKSLLKESIPNIDNLHDRLGLNDFSWLNDFIGENGTFTVLLREYENNVNEFDKIIKKLKHDNDFKKLELVSRKKSIYTSNKLIDFLARGNVLPRYGFPVDTVELIQNVTAKNIEHLRLSRDLSMAIAEYAPSSEVIADGKMYTSRYIRKTPLPNNNSEWSTAYIAKCENDECGAYNYSLTPVIDDVVCSRCGKKIDKSLFFESIEPINGFETEIKVKDVPMTRQEKNYKTEDIYIGNTEAKKINSIKFKINNIEIEIESTTNDSLLVKSTNSFYVCPKCGFSYAEDETIPNDQTATSKMKNHVPKITTTTKHENTYGSKCTCTDLKRYTLHHIFNTDVAKINFGCEASDYKTMISTTYALLYATCDYLNIERKDLKACLHWNFVNGKKQYSIIFYDAVPGGAGHSRRLALNNDELFIKIIKIAYENMVNCNCSPSCYNCLRSYENQRIHDDLDRMAAAKFLGVLLGKSNI